ncbi:unnamed protein product [Bursaphelenchus xylophilus]|uniref:(pine wood nematode) hypothetical protein n=1 Tax=Bursaphelenchus xylophilus TaxID=6326 RepID=A0A1I7S0H8_BURXY|nr:unnamed protein product [Bursaphelenchus xylophilus]CAG9132263.1 unnamed protein product [Bursaphelenchus xylophilus]
MVTLVIWLQQTWSDYKLRWDPEEYGNLTEIRLPDDALWKPDIYLFNSADENFDGRFAVNFVVRYTGDVLQAPPAIIKSSCEIDITWFPFDEQFCFLKYGSWTYSRREVNLFIEDSRLSEDNKMDLQYFVPNGAWDLIGTPAIRKPSEFDGALYVELVYYIWLRRKVLYYGINWIIPSVLFLLCTILGFSLPAESGEKITLQSQNLLSVILFLGMVSEVTPPTSTSVPIIGAFFALQMVLLGSSVIITILIINVAFRSPKTHKMTPTLRCIFLEWIPWLCMMSRPDVKFNRPGGPRRSASSTLSNTSTASSSSSEFGNIKKLLSTHQADSQVKENLIGSLANIRSILALPSQEEQPLLDENDDSDAKNEDSEPEEEISTEELLCETINELRNYLNESKIRAEEEEEEEIAQADWRFMAMAIDRVCMFVYAFLSIALPVAMYCSIPVKEEAAEEIEAMDF